MLGDRKVEPGWRCSAGPGPGPAPAKAKAKALLSQLSAGRDRPGPSRRAGPRDGAIRAARRGDAFVAAALRQGGEHVVEYDRVRIRSGGSLRVRPCDSG